MGYKVGDNLVKDFYLYSCERLLSKKDKYYLTGTVTDGKEQLKYFVWLDTNKLELDKIYTFEGEIREYNGEITLNSKSVPKLSEKQDFSPYMKRYLTEEEFKSYVTATINLIKNVKNNTYRKLAEDVMKDLGLYSDNPEKELIGGTAAKDNHHSGVGGLLCHLYCTAIGARNMASFYFNCNIDMDLLTVGGLLHDVGKAFGYKLKGANFDVTEEEILFGHLCNGVRYLDKYVTKENKESIRLVQHIIASHHENMEWGAIKTPRFIEARCVAKSDYEDMVSSIFRSEYNKEDKHNSEEALKLKLLKMELENPNKIKHILEEKTKVDGAEVLVFSNQS